MRYIPLLLMPLFSFVCSDSAKKDCLEGRIIRVTCATTVIQVLNNDTIGVDGWKDSMSSDAQTYDNVFSVANKCDFSESYKAGQKFRFKISEKKSADCMVCMMYDAPPEASYSIELCK